MEDFIINNFGYSALLKLKNMHLGGINNKKGNRFEDRFAVFKIIELANLAEQSPELCIQSQLKGYVDDFVIIYPNERAKENFQLKDVKKLTWKDVDENFKFQYKIDTEHFRIQKSKTTLLLSQKTLHNKLANTIPIDIKSHTMCEYFPNSKSLAKLILEHKPLRTALSNLSKKNDISHYEAIFTQILGVWIEDQTGKVVNILNTAKKNANPNLFHEKSELILDEEVMDILKAIKGIDVNLTNSELRISGNGIDLLFGSVASNDIHKYERLIKKARPRTLSALIDIWICNN